MPYITHHTATLILCAFPILFSQLALANDNLEPLCQAKVEEIQTQLNFAEQQGNEHEVRGLTQALDAVKDHCTNDSVLKDAEQEVRESVEEVQERQVDLESAQQEGDTDKIRKRTEKLEEAVAELEADQQELEMLLEQE